jgi:N-acetylmuramoyl-L-alanine amidase
LVETGYISNPSEEQKLKSASHQQKLATAVFRALKRHFEQSPPADSWLAQRKGQAPGRSQPSEIRSAGSSASSAQNVTRVSEPVESIVNPRLHKVTRGESLSGLAKRYAVPMSVLRSYNKLTTDNIKIGQVLRIPE